MKLRNKVIVLPILIMLTIFIVGMISIELYLKKEFTKNLTQRLQNLSLSTLTTIELIPANTHGTALPNPIFDNLANRIGETNNVRVSIFNKDGVMLGDSQLPLSAIYEIENHSDRPEIINALSQGKSSKIRYSKTLQENMIYFSAYDKNSEYIARVALNSKVYHRTIINLRWGFIAIILMTLTVMIIFGLLSMRLISKAVNKERALQAHRITEKTREITLIQTLTTMLNGLTCIDDASRIIENILPKLLPNYSGALLIIEQNKAMLKQLSSWGENKEDALIISNKWRQELTSKTDEISNNDIHIINNYIYAGLKTEAIDLGLIYLIKPDNVVSLKDQQLLSNITHQISLALANLCIKDQLRNQAIRDPLTNLYNRRFMFETFEQSLNRAIRHNSPLALLMIDIDDFKIFNDNYGHDAGDHVLTEVANILMTKSRLEDIACRFGGEEFCIICPDTDLQKAYALAEKIRCYIFELNSQFINKTLGKITISTGISLYPNHGENSQVLIKNADEALYSAKEKGRNITVMANNGLSTIYKDLFKS